MPSPLSSTSWQQGLVLSGRGGFYQVLVANRIWDCRLRGKLKRQRSQADGTGGVFAGDAVLISLPAQDTDSVPMVEQVLPRQNFLPRPRIANIDSCVAVMAARDPLYDLFLLDKILLVAAHYGIKPAICFNKADLAEDDLPPLLEVYRRAGFVALAASAYSGEGLEQLRQLLAQHVSVFAGPSGAGKSSLLNQLLPQLNAAVGEVSARLQRGRHTTRHVSLLPLPQGGLVADAPGFSLLDLPPDLLPEALPRLYPEFAAFAPSCRFLGCLHSNEPDCAIKQALQDGLIDKGRYQRYLRFLTDLQEREVKY